MLVAVWMLPLFLHENVSVRVLSMAQMLGDVVLR